MAKIDFACTDDGDLVLGTASIDSDGNILYLHADGTIDTNQYQDGVEGKTIRDMAYNIGSDAYKQIILNRLRTDAPDWFHYPQMGGNLTDLIGEPNNRATGDAGVQYIMDALTFGDLFNTNQVSVRAVPINANEIMFMITITSSTTGIYRLPLIFNLNYGLKEV